jgi:hypothetical protein
MTISLFMVFSMAFNPLWASLQEDWQKPNPTITSTVQRSIAETRFIAGEYGVHLAPKRLSRREQLALKLTLLQAGEE